MSSIVRVKVACTLAVVVAATGVSAAGAAPKRSLPVRHQLSEQPNRFQSDTIADVGYSFVTDTLGGKGKRVVKKATRSITSTYVTGGAVANAPA